jgi:hypothetical protein
MHSTDADVHDVMKSTHHTTFKEIHTIQLVVWALGSTYTITDLITKHTNYISKQVIKCPQIYRPTYNAVTQNQ